MSAELVAAGSVMIELTITSSRLPPASTAPMVHVGTDVFVKVSVSVTVSPAPRCWLSNVWPTGSMSRRFTCCVSRWSGNWTLSRQHTRSPGRYTDAGLEGLSACHVTLDPLPQVRVPPTGSLTSLVNTTPAACWLAAESSMMFTTSVDPAPSTMSVVVPAMCTVLVHESLVDTGGAAGAPAS